MAKFRGTIGFARTEETAPGIHTEIIEEIAYTGDVLRNAFNIDLKDQINPDIEASHRISVVGDAFALEHLSHIRYVKWEGVAWCVKSFEISRPRVVLTIRGVYNA